MSANNDRSERSNEGTRQSALLGLFEPPPGTTSPSRSERNDTNDETSQQQEDEKTPKRVNNNNSLNNMEGFSSQLPLTTSPTSANANTNAAADASTGLDQTSDAGEDRQPSALSSSIPVPNTGLGCRASSSGSARLESLFTPPQQTSQTLSASASADTESSSGTGLYSNNSSSTHERESSTSGLVNSLFTPPGAQASVPQSRIQVDTGGGDLDSHFLRSQSEQAPLLSASARTIPTGNNHRDGRPSISASARTIPTGNHHDNNRSSFSNLLLSSVREVPIDIPLDYSMSRQNSRIKETAASQQQRRERRRASWIKGFLADFLQPTTWIGAFMFLLYHIVFSLTMGAAIMRPHGSTPIFGIMTKMSASGVMFAAIVYWWSLSDDVPALYPAVDLFCAPFLANLAVIVDETLYADDNVTKATNDDVFLASFTFLVCLGLTITGTLLMLANVFKLANLGAFLPSPVLSGFFSAIAVLMWSLAVKVDTGGIGIGHVIFSGDWNIMRMALIHHFPSVVVGATMKVLSPRSPFYVMACIFFVIAMFYTYMGIARVGLEDMVEAGWFWSKDQFINKSIEASVAYAPPAPAGWINSLVHGKVHWGAVQAGFPTALALAFLYMIRCSLHGAALRKNIGIMQRFVTVDVNDAEHDDDDTEARKTTGEQTTTTRTTNDTPSGPGLGIAPLPRNHKRRLSETVDLSAAIMGLSTGNLADAIKSDGENNRNGGTPGKKVIVVQSQPTKHTLTEILTQYAYSQYVCALVGGFAMTPSVGPSSTMYTLGAESVAPQLGSVVFLSIFYFSNFWLVTFIPKPAFSSVLVLACIDILDGWFLKSFQKTHSKVEWLVNPFIVLTASFVGLLSSVFLGLALSTFFFIAAFYQSGVVKYVANGITIRSTIDRPAADVHWLDNNGDLLQVLVLQSYLFFGNATSVLNYVSSMFDEEDSEIERDDTELPPLPKVVILDFSLVPGIDGSAVDVMADLLAKCSENDCKLFLSGTSSSIRKAMRLGGVKPDATIKDRSERKLRFFPDLDSAVGKAEDLIIQMEHSTRDENLPVAGRRLTTGKQSAGFVRCLADIDEQHFTTFQKELVELGNYTRLVKLRPGDILYEDHTFHLDRGLFFIEEGTLRIERDASATRSLTYAGPPLSNDLNRYGNSLNQLKARRGSVAQQAAQLKAADKGGTQTFRLARIGPGWVIGDQEALSGLVNAGTTIAVDECRLHYISYTKLDRVEKENPVLILQLYKLLSKLHALRSEVTIAQLATMHSIMSAPAHNRPLITRKNPLV